MSKYVFYAIETDEIYIARTLFDAYTMFDWNGCEYLGLL